MVGIIYFHVINVRLCLYGNHLVLLKHFEMKVYTCSEAVITEFIPTSTPIFKFYRDSGIQFVLFEDLEIKLKMLKEQVCTFNDISF